MASSRAAVSPKAPDQRYLAFAVCIVHSKPAQLTIEEYISLLRRHIAKGRRENALSSVHRHLDRSSYWRSECERLEEALDASEKRRLDLTLEVERLKVKDGVVRPANSTKKRKKQDDGDVIPVPRSSKRSKPTFPEQSSGLTPLTVDTGFSFSHLGDAGEALMRSFYEAHALLKSHDRTDPALLTQHLVHAANAVPDILQRAAKLSATDDRHDLDTLKALLTAVSRSMQSLLVGYGRISNVKGGAYLQGSIIYAYVQILKKATTILGDIAKTEVQRNNRDASSLTARPSTAKSKTKQVTDSSAKRANATMSTFACFIAGNIDLLNAKMDSHKALFEGLAYVLIEKLSTCLYTLVFDRARAATMEEEVAAYSEPDDMKEADRKQSENLEVEAAKVEAPYLIQLLTRLMQVAPAHFGASVTTKSGKSKTSSKASPSKDNLAITAKERLQRTLLNCMFGAEGTDEEDPFLDCLKKPAFNGALPAVPIMKDVDVKEWFKQEVWRLLGWEILARSGALL